MRILAILTLLPLAALGSEIFTRDGVTDGETLYLAPRAHRDDYPVLQIWVTYSLIKSASQLKIGGEKPASNSDYCC